MRTFFLSDGTLMRDILDLVPRLKDGTALAIYDDLGDEASIHGPILTESPATEFDRADADLHSRRAMDYGRAQLTTEKSFEALAQHLRHRRYLRTADGQEFFFRFADSRALMNVLSVLNDSQKACFFGSIGEWAVTDVDGRSIRLGIEPASAASHTTTVDRIVLNQQALTQLTDRIWAWNLLSAAEDLDHSLQPDATDAQKLAWCESATAIAQTVPKCSFAAQTLVALAMIQSEGRAFTDPAFARSVDRARASGDLSQLKGWLDSHRAWDGAR